MKPKTTIVGQYKRYLKAIETCDKQEVPQNFSKFQQFIDKEADGDLYVFLKLASVKMTLVQVRKRGVALRKELTKDFWDVFNSLKRHIEEQKSGRNLTMSCPDEIKVQFARVLEQINKQTDHSTQLYMWLCYDNNIKDHLLTKWLPTVDRLTDAESEEEIEAVLEDASRNTLKTVSVNPTTDEEKESLDRECCKQISEMYKHFNPKNIEEAEENIEELNSMLTNGEILKGAYDVVNEYLLSRKHIYSNGNTYKEPQTTPLNFEIIDGEKFLEEDELEAVLSVN